MDDSIRIHSWEQRRSQQLKNEKQHQRTLVDVVRCWRYNVAATRGRFGVGKTAARTWTHLRLQIWVTQSQNSDPECTINAMKEVFLLHYFNKKRRKSWSDWQTKRATWWLTGGGGSEVWFSGRRQTMSEGALISDGSLVVILTCCCRPCECERERDSERQWERELFKHLCSVDDKTHKLRCLAQTRRGRGLSRLTATRRGLSGPESELYLPKRKADKVGLTRSPLAELFGFWRRRGPASPMMSAPTGAVRRMASTATVSTSMPYFCSVRSFLFRAMSKAVEPMAAWRRPEKTGSPPKSPKKKGKDPQTSVHRPELWLWASTQELWRLSPSCWSRHTTHTRRWRGFGPAERWAWKLCPDLQAKVEQPLFILSFSLLCLISISWSQSCGHDSHNRSARSRLKSSHPKRPLWNLSQPKWQTTTWRRTT